MPKRVRPKPTKILKADLHIHTAHSGDSDISSWDIIEMARDHGLDVVGVTDHHSIRGGIETKNLAKKEFPELIVLVGQEVKTKSGEIIIFGLEKDIPRGLPLEETCKRARKAGGFIVMPHPYDRLRGGIGGRIKEVIEYIDAVEVLNSKSVWKRFNKKARDFAEAHKLPMIAGSDAHIPQYIGCCYTLIDAKPDEKSIYMAIKAGRTEVSGTVVGLRGAGFRARFGKIAKKMRK